MDFKYPLTSQANSQSSGSVLITEIFLIPQNCVVILYKLLARHHLEYVNICIA